MLTSGIITQQRDIPPELAQFETNKHIPSIIRKNVLTALSFYPELTKTPIDFVFRRNIKSSVMQAQPVFVSLLRSRSARAYRINISAMFKLTHTAIPIHQLPDDIMIGWIGHELGHIMDYESRSNIGMVGFGLGYVFSANYVRKAEQLADQYAVDHGLGKYLIVTKRFILDHAELPQAYKDKIARLYVSPEVIVEQVRKLEEAKLEQQRNQL
ncbi:hypothetical protein ACFSUS_01280 [Spirosoma soli]|uniref:Uncharacterized protein n=1 Tax=Spirosoma soli TaxID=1770529 RepID=A0ABW5LXB9_9BACT